MPGAYLRIGKYPSPRSRSIFEMPAYFLKDIGENLGGDEKWKAGTQGQCRKACDTIEFLFARKEDELVLRRVCSYDARPKKHAKSDAADR